VVGILFAVAFYMMIGGDLKSICMGVFVLGHGANLAILSSSRSPIGKLPPVLMDAPPAAYADPLPQALILTAIVIGFAVQAFLLTMLIVTYRRTRTLVVDDLVKGAAHD
jgi:multicomponent Na+:H+ antiporter subunit C